MIKLKSKDEKVFEVPIDNLERMGTVKTMLECGDFDGGDNIIPLPNVKAKSLDAMLKWCEFHKKMDSAMGEASEDEIKKLLAEKDQWQKKFLSVDKSILYDYIISANYLEMQDLLDLACLTVSKMLEGLKAHEIREKFGLKNDSNGDESTSTAN